MAQNLEDFIKKYNPHAETVQFLKARAEDGVPPYFEIGVERARLESIKASEKYGGKIDFDGADTELFVPSPHCSDGIPVSVYFPVACQGDATPTILVYFHGGGNVVGCRQTHETICKILARDAQCIVVNVEYRRGPEHRFPANNDDAKCVVQWVAENKHAVGGGSGSKLGVAGDSAGGRIAAVVSYDARDLIDFSVLVYPNTTMHFNYPSIEEFREGPGLSYKLLQWFMGNYLTGEEDRNDPRASVLLREDCSNLPPTLIIVAQLDPLRDGCYAYATKLKAAGVEVEVRTIQGVLHAFWSLTGAYLETGKEAQGYAIQFIRKFKA
ncbi:esterase LipI-like [Dreissena polymorpha]|uniref:Alpha/beta hydrolase fold-3 domain-containing protein n=1 Tax=Dreissena polymorpha TaxID=45954 RepID=A0A9D4KZ20_DREPO|nr:esterase LipI-like [Dreissena polymorpha]KAH3848254.1 hypothetical protein DPMN_090613 [Dreissena polymorpha]